MGIEYLREVDPLEFAKNLQRRTNFEKGQTTPRAKSPYHMLALELMDEGRRGLLEIAPIHQHGRRYERKLTPQQEKNKEIDWGFITFGETMRGIENMLCQESFTFADYCNWHNEAVKGTALDNLEYYTQDEFRVSKTRVKKMWQINKANPDHSKFFTSEYEFKLLPESIRDFLECTGALYTIVRDVIPVYLKHAESIQLPQTLNLQY